MCSENERPDRLIRMLYDIADDAEAPANSRLSAIKEILDRTVGKGVMLGGEQTEIQPVEIVDFLMEKKLNDVKLQIQLHKVIWDPQKRGV